MRTPFILSLAAFSAAVAPGPAPAETAAPVTVRLTSFDFTPSTIRLRAGQPVILHLVNASGGGHNFSAPAFFRAARIDPGSAGRVHDGTVDVRSHGEVDVRLVPAAGHYRLRCTHFMHPTLGMTGEIVVE